MALTSTQVILVEATEHPPDEQYPKGRITHNNIYLADLKKTQIVSMLIKVATYPDRYTMVLAAEYRDPFREDNKDMITLTEYLEEKGIKVDRSQKHRLANVVNEMYIAETGSPPRTVFRNNPSGKWLSRASGFEREYSHILDKAIEETLG